ncbi:MAG: anthranilate phosphoribosyltransferase [Victivallaceae bacterium]|nr:anthranilate phosphoribosyltransferase [Victivallaceae bacterium]
MLKPYLKKILAGEDLTAEETSTMLEILTRDDVSPCQAGAVLTAMRAKGESVAELVGGGEMLRRHARTIDCGIRECVDLVGTGGDGGISFNVSTTAAIVAAGAGVVIAKHGNRAVSGKSGAADVLAALGYNLNVAPERIEESVMDHGIGFLFAQKMHPVMSKVAAFRKDLGVRTIFNLLGPLANPAGVRHMVVGVYDPSLTELYAGALRDLGIRRALIVHGNDGLDEISCCDCTRVTELNDGAQRSYNLYPELLLGTSYDREEIAGGTPEENARITRAILDGTNQGAPRAIVLLNAAAACYVAGLAADLKAGVALAAESIDSGRAQRKLELLIEESNR